MRQILGATDDERTAATAPAAGTNDQESGA
jgi:hypothetical protein